MSITQQQGGAIGAPGRHLWKLPALGLLVLAAWMIFGGVHAALAFVVGIYVLAVLNLSATMYERGA